MWFIIIIIIIILMNRINCIEWPDLTKRSGGRRYTRSFISCFRNISSIVIEGPLATMVPTLVPAAAAV
jgi:hypothetical protein